MILDRWSGIGSVLVGNIRRTVGLDLFLGAVHPIFTNVVPRWGRVGGAVRVVCGISSGLLHIESFLH